MIKKQTILFLFFGFIIFELFPPHNEPISPFTTIARYRLEASVDYSILGFNFAWNPVVWADGRWPEMVESYKPDRWFLENHFRIEKSYKNYTLFFNKINYYPISNDAYGLPVWWSYGNGVGIRYNF